jgi:hypothetical protein
MLLYVCSNTRPDLQFSVHQVCQFAHKAKKSHGQAVKWILRYLVVTREKGLKFIPNLEEGLDCYVDTDFAELWGHEDDQDPVSVHSRTGFTLTLFRCPILWSSKAKVVSPLVRLIPSTHQGIQGHSGQVHQHLTSEGGHTDQGSPSV